MLQPVKPGESIKLRNQDAQAPHDKPRTEIEREMAGLTSRMVDLQLALYAESRQALLVILQGRDASGKDGTTRHVFAPLNAQGCVVTSFKQPNALELSHDYLWRVHQAVPPAGTIGIFNRSHYEDVLVVRVHQLVPQRVWSRRYDQINQFERMLAENNVTIIKFFLHISRREQEERLLARLKDPRKNWKFQLGDLKDREAWDDYTEAYEDALSRCSTPWAPWYVVPADRKPIRNLMVAQVVLKTLEDMNPRIPKADPAVLAAAREWERDVKKRGQDETT